MSTLTLSLEEQLSCLTLPELNELLISLGDYDEPLVGIEEFLDHPDYLGGYFQGNLYPFWREVLKEIYPSPYYSPYWLVSLKGSIGAGKTSIANTILAYDIYRTLSLKNPQSFYNLIPSTKILFFLMNNSLDNVSAVGFDQLQQMLMLSPFFKERMDSKKEYKKQTKDKDASLFPKRVDIGVGSRIGHTLGKALFSCMIDEAAFSIVTDQLRDNFNSVVRRMQSRFMDSSSQIPGKMLLVSSESEKGSDFNHIVDKYKNQEGVLVIQKPLWAVKPHNYSGETFKVFIGSEAKPPAILETSLDQYSDIETSLIIDVPVEHRKDFENDLNNSIRDLAGHPTGSSYSLFRLKDKITKALCISAIFPDSFILDFDNTEDTIQKKLLFPNYFLNPWHKNRPRFIHIDTALSGDKLGMACTYIAGFVKKEMTDMFTLEKVAVEEPELITEWAFAVSPTPGKQIPLVKIILFIKWLSRQGVTISGVTADSFQSAMLLQMLTSAGYSAKLLSVDRTVDPYMNLRNSVYADLWKGPDNKLLKKELLELEVSADRKKVDHKTDGSKDIADCIAGSHENARENADKHKYMVDSIDVDAQSVNTEKIKELFWS